ncbi:Organic cation transporter protein [Portunus trituberculatus]|uniref:Organic cation transporter protein n=1 Tax=Portunus trituberculatus TaxID=210409 RepID=A0A5B7FP62_PORTR|nr:Organic cation transporter protein [Portunus trituberculatus]
MVTYTLASIAAPAIAYLVWDWTYLTLIAAIPSLAFLLGFKWLPESASWLLTKGRVEAARTQLSRVAKVNKQELSGERLTTLLVEAGEGEADGDKKKSGGGVSILQAVQYPKLRCNILLVLLVWMLACMCFYGHCQNTANLGSSVLMSYLLGAVVEVPSWCVPLLIHRFGRRMPLASAFLISALAGFIYALVPADMEWLVLVVALMGRASITGAYYITLQYGPEIFPTEVRGQGVALSETLGGVAIFISPMVVYLEVVAVRG